MGNHRLIHRRAILALGLILLGLGIAGLLYDATRLRSVQTRVRDERIAQSELLPPQPAASPASTPQASPKPLKPRLETKKSSAAARRPVVRHHASRVHPLGAVGPWPSQNASTPAPGESPTEPSENPETHTESLLTRPSVVRQPGSRCTRLTRSEGKRVGIFKGVLNLFKRILGMKPPPIILPNSPLNASLAASAPTITMPCDPGTYSSSGGCPATANTTVALTTTASDPDGDTLLYMYTVTGGRVTGEGTSVSWDLSGVGPGTYTSSVEVDDGCGCITSSTTTVTIAKCSDCNPELACPSISSACPDAVDPGNPITFSANVGRATPPASTYNWTVSAGTITGGQGTASITVRTDGLAGRSGDQPVTNADRPGDALRVT